MTDINQILLQSFYVNIFVFVGMCLNAYIVGAKLTWSTYYIFLAGLFCGFAITLAFDIVW